jgi:hypothetical protein
MTLADLVRRGNTQAPHRLPVHFPVAVAVAGVVEDGTSTIAASSALIAAYRGSLSWGFVASALLFNPDRHHLPRLENDSASLGHRDCLAGTGIAGLTSLPAPDLKHPEVAKLDPTVLHQDVHDGVKRLLDDLLGLLLCQAKLLGNRSDDAFPGHELISLP